MNAKQAPVFSITNENGYYEQLDSGSLDKNVSDTTGS